MERITALALLSIIQAGGVQAFAKLCKIKSAHVQSVCDWALKIPGSFFSDDLFFKEDTISTDTIYTAKITEDFVMKPFKCRRLTLENVDEETLQERILPSCRYLCQDVNQIYIEHDQYTTTTADQYGQVVKLCPKLQAINLEYAGIEILPKLLDNLRPFKASEQEPFVLTLDETAELTEEMIKKLVQKLGKTAIEIVFTAINPYDRVKDNTAAIAKLFRMSRANVTVYYDHACEEDTEAIKNQMLEIFKTMQVVQTNNGLSEDLVLTIDNRQLTLGL